MPSKTREEAYEYASVTSQGVTVPTLPPEVTALSPLDQALMMAGFPPGTPLYGCGVEPGLSNSPHKKFLEQAPKQIMVLDEPVFVGYCGINYTIYGSKVRPLPVLVPQPIAQVIAGKKAQERTFLQLSAQWEASAVPLDINSLPTQVFGPEGAER